MADDADALIERQRLRRRLTFWRVLFVIALAVAVIVAVNRFSTATATGSRVALLDVTGIIQSDKDRDEALRRIADDDAVRALVVRINSPGGTFVGGEALNIALSRVAQAKPVVVVMEDVAASAGYMIAVAGERIFARRGTVTGSIGVIFQTANIVGMLDSLGISVDPIKSDPLKAQPSPFEEPLPDALAWTQVVVDEMQDVFIDIVDAGRPGLDRAAVVALADGRIYTGDQALENGLVDELGGIVEARAWLAETHQVGERLPLVDVEIDEDENWLVELLTETGKSVLPEPLTLDGVLAVWQPSSR